MGLLAQVLVAALIYASLGAALTAAVVQAIPAAADGDFDARRWSQRALSAQLTLAGALLTALIVLAAIATAQDAIASAAQH